MRTWSLQSMPPVKAMRGPGGRHDLGVGLAAGGEEVAAVDHRGGQGAAVDHRADLRAPQRAGRGLEQAGGVIAAEFEGVAPFDQADALRGQPLELDRFDLGAVLFELALALRLLVGVELALDALGLAVEQIDEGPEQIVGVVLEAGAGEQGFERFGDGAEMALDGFVSGHRPRIGLVLSRPVAVQRQLVEQIRGRRGGVVFGLGIAVGEGEGAVVRRHGGAFLPEGIRPRPSRPSRRSQAGDGDAAHPQGRSNAEDGGGEAFCFAMQSRPALPGRRRKMRTPRHCAGDQGGPLSGRPAAPADRRSGRPWRGPLFPAERLSAARTNRLSSFRRDPVRRRRYAGPP